MERKKRVVPGEICTERPEKGKRDHRKKVCWLGFGENLILVLVWDHFPRLIRRFSDANPVIANLTVFIAIRFLCEVNILILSVFYPNGMRRNINHFTNDNCHFLSSHPLCVLIVTYKKSEVNRKAPKS